MLRYFFHYLQIVFINFSASESVEISVPPPSVVFKNDVGDITISSTSTSSSTFSNDAPSLNRNGVLGDHSAANKLEVSQMTYL